MSSAAATASKMFPDPLDLRDNFDRTYTLLSPFRFGPSAVAGRVIEVPAGTNTDFASIPEVFQNILHPDGKYGRAAVVHDYLYSTLGLQGELTRAQCDAILLEGMVALGVGFFTRLVIYGAVRICGGSHWKADVN